MANYTILLIDYEPRSIERFRDPLVAAGYSVETATDGLSGIEAFHRLNPDLVLVEAMIPKKHGFEVCQELKRTPHGRRTPILITTGVYKGRKYRTQALHIYGCDEYIEKPIAPEQLLEIVGRFLGPGATGSSTKTADAAPASPDTGNDVGKQRGVDAAAKNAPSPKRRTPADPKPKPDSVPEAIAKNDAEDEITARLDALLSTGGGAIPAAIQPAPVVIIATLEEDPFGQMRAELDSEFGSLATPLAFESTPRLEPMPEPIPTDQAVSPSVLEALPPLDAEIQLVPRPAMPATTDESPEPLVDDGAKRPRKNKKSERQSKGRSPQIAQVSQVAQVAQVAQAAQVAPAAPAPVVVAARAIEPPVAALEVTLPRGTLVESELESTATRRGVPVWAWAAVGLVAIITLYFLFASGGSNRSDAAPPTITRGAAPRPVVAAPPVESAPVESPSRESAPTTSLPDKSKLVLNAVNVPLTQKPGKRGPTPSPATSVATPPVASGSASNSVSDPTPAPPEVSPPQASAAPDLDANVAGVETVPDPTLRAAATTMARGALIPIDAADTMPVSLLRRTPVYSMQAKQLRVSGTVVMNVLINERGTVDQVVLVTGVPGADVNDAAMSAAKAWTYRPATKNGVPVKVWKSEQVVFKL